MSLEIRIKEICKSKGMTLAKLADAIGVPASSLSQIMRGNPTLSKLQAIADALNVEVAELFERRGDFVAFVRDQGRIYTFDTIEALKEFTDAAHGLKDKMRQLGDVSNEIKGQGE